MQFKRVLHGNQYPVHGIFIRTPGNIDLYSVMVSKLSHSLYPIIVFFAGDEED
jgi:hypothetical protein